MKEKYKLPNGKIIKCSYEKALKLWQSGKYGSGYENKRSAK
jgi:hypothetical protein